MQKVKKINQIYCSSDNKNFRYKLKNKIKIIKRPKLSNSKAKSVDAVFHFKILKKKL